MPSHLSSPFDDQHLFFSGVLADVLDGLGHRTSCLPPNVRPLHPAWKVFGRAATLSMAAVASDAGQALRPGVGGHRRPATGRGAGRHDQRRAGERPLGRTALDSLQGAGRGGGGHRRPDPRHHAHPALDFPVFATGYSPLDSKGRIDGISRAKPIRIGECVVKPGDWVLGDVDGVAVVPAELADDAFAKAKEKVSGENRVARSWPAAAASAKCSRNMEFCERTGERSKTVNASPPSMVRCSPPSGGLRWGGRKR